VYIAVVFGRHWARSLAQNPQLPRRDALKVLSADLSRDRDFGARFVREADVASALDHPNIVLVFARFETDDGQLWIAMQFVDGTEADAALRAGTMTPPRAMHVVSGCQGPRSRASAQRRPP
jgi:serine/threonine-protein kinase